MVVNHLCFTTPPTGSLIRLRKHENNSNQFHRRYKHPMLDRIKNLFTRLRKVIAPPPPPPPPPPPRNLIFNPPGQYINPSYGTPLDSRPDGKVVVFGLPKSGNVWLVSLLSDYTGLPIIDPMLKIEEKGVGMCHLPYSEDFEKRLDILHAVYIVRDLRDIIVSYFHYAQTDYYRKIVPCFYYDKIEDFYFEWFLPRIVPFHRVMTHAVEYTNLGIPPIKYERLFDDTVGELTRLISRFGLPVDKERILHAVNNNRIDNLQRSGKQMDVFVPPTHFLKVAYCEYKNELPLHVLQHVNTTFGDLLSRWGYQL